MSNKKQETIAAAVRREREATREKSLQVGNSAKIREALDRLLNFLRWVYAQDYPVSRDKLADAIDIGVSALAAPPRNCDVGKPEEQQDRFREFCRRHFDARECGLGRSVAKCPAYQGGKNPDCSLWWAQMPYEEGGEK